MEERALLALDEFCRSLFFPALESCSNLREDQNYRESSLRLTLLEAVLWLDAGTLVGLFDAALTHSVLLKIRASLDEQFTLLAAELESGLLQKLLLRTHHILDGLQPERSFQPAAPQALWNRFQIILGLVARLNSDSAVANTTAALTILTNSAWERFLATSLSAEDLQIALEGRSNPWIFGYASIAKAGCFSLIEFLDGLLNALRLDEIPEGVETKDWIGFRRLIAEVMSTRFDFGNSIFTERFEKLVNSVGNTALAELRRFGATAEPEGWSDFARTLIRSWRDLSYLRGLSATGNVG